MIELSEEDYEVMVSSHTPAVRVQETFWNKGEWAGESVAYYLDRGRRILICLKIDDGSRVTFYGC